MNDPENKPVTQIEEANPSSADPLPTGPQDTLNNPESAEEKKKPSKKPKVKTGDIYALVENAHVPDARLIDRVFETIETEADSPSLISSLLRDFMEGRRKSIWKILREFDVPARLFDKLCQFVGVPGLGNAWSLMGRDAAGEIERLLREYVPPSREAAELFLRDRSMLPLSILLYRGYRNDEATMGRVLRDWVAAIASGCENQRKDVQKEAQRAAKWLADLSSKKSNPTQFLSAIAPVLVSLRLGQSAFNEVADLTIHREQLESEIKAKTTEIEALADQLRNLEVTVENQKAQIAAAAATLKQSEDKLAFGSAHAGESVTQAVGAVKEKLRTAILAHTEDARLFLDRPDPNIQQALESLLDIDKQFR